MTHRIAALLSARVLLAVLFVGSCATLLPHEAGAQPASSGHPQRTATLSGSVADVSGRAVGHAQVSLEPGNRSSPVKVETDASGEFVMGTLQPGRYTIHATHGGVESDPTSVIVTAGLHQDIRLVLGAARASPAANVGGSTEPADSMDFVDKPTFTVAGVTDWTAVGGHGSDATLRTSEELNREALALRAQAPKESHMAKQSEEEASLRAAVSTSPDSYLANRDLGLFYLHGAQFTQAIPLLEKASHIGGDKAGDEYNLALAQQGLGDFNAAQVHVKRALAQRDAGEFHRLAGELQEQLGNPLGAVQEEARATELDPSEANYFAWGTELLLHRAIWQAADVFAKGAKAYPASVRLRTGWGAALFAGANYDEAAAKICEASDLDPSAREPYLFAGQIALASPSIGGCMGKTLERFLSLRPDDAEANYFYAMFLLKEAAGPAQDRSRQLLLRAVALDAKCSDGFLQLGIMSAAKKDYASAIAYYRRALEADPQKGEAHYRLAIAYDRTGEPEKAKVEYRLHEQIDAANAARVEGQRREVKQFSIVTNSPPAKAAAQ